MNHIPRDPQVPSATDHLWSMCPVTMEEIEEQSELRPGGERYIALTDLAPLLIQLLGEAYPKVTGDRSEWPPSQISHANPSR